MTLILNFQQYHFQTQKKTVIFVFVMFLDALDMATKFADSLNASIVLANDPDADRFAVAERQPK